MQEVPFWEHAVGRVCTRLDLRTHFGPPATATHTLSSTWARVSTLAPLGALSTTRRKTRLPKETP